MAMDSSSAQSHHQEVGSQTLESMLASTKPQQEKKARPAEQSLKCPRCDSSNTKFCYYNNYSLSQPRYFCKSCRRYWTKGGTLRNVPVGGGCRKAKRSSSSSSSSSSTSSRRVNHDHPITSSLPNPTLPIPSYTYGSINLPTPGQLGLDHNHHGFLPVADHCGMVDALRGGFLEIPRFQNLYSCGNGDGNGSEFGMGMGIGVLNEEMGLMGFEEFGSGSGSGAAAMTTTTTSGGAVKQEMCSNSSGGGLFPWQNVGGEGSLDSTRIGSWINGIGSSPAWHGLLNTPLM